MSYGERVRGRVRIQVGFLVPVLLLGWLPAEPASADGDAFQRFFFRVCRTATGALESRCNQTPGGRGALSSESQDSLNPTQVLTLNDSGLARARATSKEVQERLEKRRDEASQPAETGVTDSRWGFFLNGRGELFDRDRTSRERGYDGFTAGGQLGADYRIGEGSFLGAILAYDRSETEFDRDRPGLNFFPQRNDGESESDHFGITLYGSSNLTEGLYVEGSLGYGYTDIDFDRRAVFQESRQRIPQTNVRGRGDTRSHEWLAGGAVGYDVQLGRLSVGPYARLHYARSHVSGYRERDASGLQMRISGDSQDSLTSVLGGRAGMAFGTSFGVVIPQVRLEWEHEFLRDRKSVATSFPLDSARNVFRVRGDDPDRDTWNAAIGVLLVLPGGWMPFADYEALLGHSFLDRHRVVAGVRKEF